jgi:energy-converting hydrogenase B subunit D
MIEEPMPDLLLDLILAAALLLVAWKALTGPELFASVVLFMAFGLLMALAWIRLLAPDIALAEAAIGAGITGALLLGAVRQMENSR